MNVLTLRNDAVEFIGFDNLKSDGIVTIRIISDKLVVNLGDIQTEIGKLLIQLNNRKSSDPNLCALFKHYCKDSPTAFVSVKPTQTEYVQQFPITEQELESIVGQ